MIVTMDSVEFFRDNAGTSYYPDRETPEVGVLRLALELASAEAHAAREGWVVSWEIDPDPIWDDDVERETTDYDQYACDLRDADGVLLASIGSVDFGPIHFPDQEPYARVLAAELAIEAMHAERAS